MARPKGSKNKPIAHSEAQPSRCPNCGSTERTAYFGMEAQEFDGVDDDGQPFTHIIRRRTACQACGQHRIDRSYENRPSEDLTDTDDDGGLDA